MMMVYVFGISTKGVCCDALTLKVHMGMLVTDHHV
jgi:hypothetical protein